MDKTTFKGHDDPEDRPMPNFGMGPKGHRQDEANPSGIPRPRLQTKNPYQQEMPMKSSRPMIPVHTKSKPYTPAVGEGNSPYGVQRPLLSEKKKPYDQDMDPDD